MRWTPVSIGTLKVSILLASVLWASNVHAEVSASYTLVNDFPNAATNNGGSSTNFVLVEGQETWTEKPLSSTNFQMVLPGGGYGSSSSSSTSSSSSSSSSSTSSIGGDTGNVSSSRPTGSRGDRVSRHTGEATHASSAFTPSPSSIAGEDAGHGAAPADTDALTSSAQSSVAGAMRIQPAVSVGDNPVSFFGATEFVYESHPSTARVVDAALRLSTTLLWLLFVALFACISIAAHVTSRRARIGVTNVIVRIIGYLSRLVMALLVIMSLAGVVHAVQTVPHKHVYNGRLLDSSGSPVTASTSIRFSYWKSVDFLSSDITGAGAIDTAATNYAGWQETHTVTPNSSGYFSVVLGSINELPDFSTLPVQVLVGLYLQVDVKAAASADTSYELLDSDPTDTGIDRTGIFSVPFADNADMLDQREIGTGSGDIAILKANGVFPVSTIPNGTNASSFTLDADNTEISEIALTFGEALGKKLTYDIVNSIFRFNTSVEIQGNLTVTGLINGMNLTSIQNATGALKAFSGGGLNLGVSNGAYRLNGVITNYDGGTIAMPASSTRSVFFGSGGLTHAAAFPSDESFIPVAVVTTSAGSIVSVEDRRTLSSDDREHSKTITFNPAFEKASYQGDGADNIGQLSVSHDNITLSNFYVWTTTKSTLQDYDILLRVPVPEHFVRWRTEAAYNPISLTYRSTSASTSDNKLDIQIMDTNGVPVTLSGSVSNLAHTSWTTSQIEFTGNPTWTAGQDMMVKLHLSAKDAYQMHIGSLKLQLIELE